MAKNSATRASAGSSEAAEEDYDAPQQGAGQTRREEADCRTPADLGKVRIRHHCTCQRPNVELLRDRQRPGADELAGVGAHDGGAEDASAPGGQHLDVAVSLALLLRPGALVIGPAQHPEAAKAPARLAFAEPHMGELRVGEGDAGNGAVRGP